MLLFLTMSTIMIVIIIIHVIIIGKALMLETSAFNPFVVANLPHQRQRTPDMMLMLVLN